MKIRFLDEISVVRLARFLICIHFSLCDGCVEKERESFLEFKHSLNDTQDSLSSWINEDCCNWYGVVCNNLTGHVTELGLSSYGVVGSEVSPSLTELKYLEYLDLRYNDFAGSEIPKFFGNFTKLKHLYLSGASFVGVIPPLGNLSALATLDISWNHLSGSIPSFLGNLSALTKLDLSWNQLSGSIPSSFGTLPALKELTLDSNKLSGILPTSLGRLSKLEKLSLNNNSFTGVVSEVHFRQLSSLEVLDMGSNFLIFSMSYNWVPAFKVRVLSLGSCKLGPEIPPWLQTQIHLISLKMPNTSISEVPTWFWNFSSRLSTLDLSSNQIRGPVPILQHNVSVYDQTLLLHSNRFEGTLPQFPSNVVVLDLSNNSISGPFSQHIGNIMPNLQLLLLSNNTINGSLPASLCKLNKLRIIDISNNHLSGSVPNCWKDATNMKVLNLATNNLTGLIPSSLGDLLVLMSVRLSNNKFHGEIPPSLKHCPALKVIDLGHNDLSGNIPSWFGERSFLNIIRLKSNSFGGSLSPQLCGMTRLQILDLSQNHLSGEIPPCLHNFTGMKLGISMNIYGALGYDESLFQVIKGTELEYTTSLKFLVNFDLSSNDFVGQIPEELVSLDGLKALNLSNNRLTGEIPRELGKLKSLESLDFSKNLLSGMIPQSLSDLGFLSAMNLSFNNLSGKIPSGQQLQTFSSSTYTGNSQLCGFPLEKNCSQDIPSQVTDHRGNVDGEDDGKIKFYISMAVGTVAGFWGVFAVLLFKKSWRYSYFQFVERMHDRLLLTIALLVLSLKRKLEDQVVE